MMNFEITPELQARILSVSTTNLEQLESDQDSLSEIVEVFKILKNFVETQTLLETSDDIVVGIKDYMTYQERQEFLKTRKYRKEK